MPAKRGCSRSKTVALASGSSLFRQGDAGDGCYWVRRGALKVAIASQRGQERIIALLGAREASARLFMKLDTTPPLTHAELARALDGVVIVRLTPSGLP